MINTPINDKINNLNNLITGQSLFYIHKIGEFKGKQIIYNNQQPEYLNKLQLSAITDNAIASNSIDNISISSKRFKELFEEISSPENSVESEVIRYVKVLNLINSHYESITISPEIMLQFHRNLFRYKPEQGGNWKTELKNIERRNDNGSIKIVFVPLEPEKTPERIANICSKYNKLIKQNDTIDLLVIATFIFDFLCIQPFENGNGRLARLLTQLLLYQNNYQVAKYISLDKITLNNKQKYFEALEKSSQKWHQEENDLSSWIEFFLANILEGYTKLDNQMFDIKNKKGAKSQQVKMIIEQLPSKFKVADIADKCPGISRPTINKVLQELRDTNEIKPCSLGRDAIWQKNS
ncbi:MAG: Fic family protein [Vampirovibrionia bacterium]